MFDTIRNHQRLLLFFLVILILPAFVFFGISGYDRILDDSDVATVDGTPITEQEFAEAQRREIDNLRQMLGDAVDVKMFDTPEARREIVEGLITRRVIAAEAARARIAVSDEQVRDAILAIPGLRREDGSFDDARYRAMLSSQNMTAAGFESLLRSDLALQALPEAVRSSAFVPRTLVDRIILLQEETREVREMRFSADAFASAVKPTPEELKKFYDDNLGLFETPESAKVEYVALSREALASQVNVGPDDLRAYYEQNRSRFGTEEERRASHILVKAGPDAKAKADALLAQLEANPGQFAEIAKTNSDDPGSAAQGGDLGFFDRSSMVKPFADAAFDMKEGEIRGPVESEFGLHIIKLTDIKPAQIKSFEEVRPQLEAEIRAQQAAQRFAEAAETFTNTVYEQSDSLKPVADKFKLDIRTVDGVRRQPDPRAEAGSPLANQRLLAMLFSDEVLKNKRNTEAIEVSPGTLVSARVIDYRPPQRQPYAEVEAAVEKLYVAREAAELARHSGQERLKALKQKQPDAEEREGFGPKKSVKRGSTDELDRRAVDAIFRMPSDELPSFTGVDLGEQGYAIFELVSVTPPSAEVVAQRRPEFEQQLTRIVGQQDLASYIESLKQRTKIVRNLERLSRADERP